MPDPLPRWADADALAAWLARGRNDLEPAACRLEPRIGEVLRLLGATPGCALARMSGSGASCFGLYRDAGAAREAAEALAERRPGWWLRAAAILREAPAVQLTRETT